MFVFGDFNIHHKDWLTYSSRTDRPGELCYNFYISNEFTQMVNFPTRIQDCDSHIPALLGLFLSSDASICSTMALPPLRNSDMLLSQFPLNSHQIHNRIPRFIAQLMTIPVLIRKVFVIFKLSASAAANEFCKWVQVGIDAHIPHQKYQVLPHSSPWFSAVCAAAIVHRNHFFPLYQQNKSSKSKVKFRQASYRYKRVLEAAKLAYANKTKESIISQKLHSRDF